MLKLMLKTDYGLGFHSNQFLGFSKLCWLLSHNPNLGGLFRGSFWGRGKITPCPKLVKIMLEI